MIFIYNIFNLISFWTCTTHKSHKRNHIKSPSNTYCHREQANSITWPFILYPILYLHSRTVLLWNKIRPSTHYITPSIWVSHRHTNHNFRNECYGKLITNRLVSVYAISSAAFRLSCVCVHIYLNDDDETAYLIRNRIYRGWYCSLYGASARKLRIYGRKQSKI